MVSMGSKQGGLMSVSARNALCRFLESFTLEKCLCEKTPLNSLIRIRGPPGHLMGKVLAAFALRALV